MKTGPMEQVLYMLTSCSKFGSSRDSLTKKPAEMMTMSWA